MFTIISKLCSSIYSFWQGFADIDMQALFLTVVTFVGISLISLWILATFFDRFLRIGSIFKSNSWQILWKDIKEYLPSNSFGRMIVIIAALIWLELFAKILYGLLDFLFIQKEVLSTPKNERELDLTVGIALIATLSALVALPFTIWRLQETRRQNDHNELKLFNVKLTAATNDLFATHEVSTFEDNNDGNDRDKTNLQPVRTFIKDDFLKRIIALNTLKRLFDEKQNDVKVATEICSIISEYVQTMSHASYSNPDKEFTKFEDTSFDPGKAVRKDTQKAVQILCEINATNKLKPDYKINLSNTNLIGMDLSKLNFKKINLTGANLAGANLSGTNLTEANLTGANLTGAILESAILANTMLSKAILFETNFSYASFSYTKEQRLTNVKFKHSKFLYTRFRYLTLSGDNFHNPSFGGTAIRDSILEKNMHCHLTTSNTPFFLDGTVEIDSNAREDKGNIWPDTILNDKDYEKEYERFLKEGPNYIPPQLRGKNQG